MEKNTVEDNIYWLLIQVAARTKHGLMRLAEKHDLTVVQLHVLGIMQSNEPLPMSTISDTLLCDASNITGIVDRLLSRGYITREESPGDRRVKMISLTLKGKALRHKLFTDMQQYEMPEFQRLTLQQRTQLREITSTLLRPTN